MLKGQKHTENTKIKISKKNKGQIPWNKNKIGLYTAEYRMKLSKIAKQRFATKENHPCYGRHLSDEHKRKLIENNKGRRLSKKHREILSKINMGRKLSDETKRKISETKKGKISHRKGVKLSKRTREKISKANIGKHRSIEFKRKISLANEGINNPFYGKKHTKKSKMKMSNSQKIIGKDISVRMKQQWQNPEYKAETIKAILKASYIKPNKKELLLNSILNDLYPNDWQYVGDGQVILGGFCPDFINVNGKKQIIEMNGDYWHNRQGVAEKDKRKMEAYKQLGYKTLTIWEHELKNIDIIKNKIKQFTMEI